jgi:3-oxoacyl-[acyl-carrier protein] reductase
MATRPSETKEPRRSILTNLVGRIALVTGASQGIGRACALELARNGATVALAARNLDKLESVAAEIVAAGGAAKAFALDVASEDSIKACAKAVIAEFGAVHILVNNAGITKDNLLLRMKRQEWDDVMSTNLTGAFLLTQACTMAMLKARWGRIINITSIIGEVGQGGQVNYAASKAGMIGLTKSIARELASRGITCNAVAPGYIETAMTAVLTDEQKTAVTAHIPLQRVGADSDIAAAVAFLASEGAGYITGHTLDVNGGMYMG